MTAQQTFGGASFATTPVTFSIIAVTAAIYVLGFLSAEMDNTLIRNFASVNILIEDGEWWRVLTAAFLHGSLFHIGFNMYALYLFGPRLEREVGGPAFAALYFAAAAGGGAASSIFGPTFVISIGASGAIFGLFGAWMFVAYKLRATPAGRAMFNQLSVLLAINLALPIIIPNIDWRAHVGGLITGVGVAWLWSVLAAGRSNARVIRTVVGTAVLLMALALVVTF